MSSTVEAQKPPCPPDIETDGRMEQTARQVAAGPAEGTADSDKRRLERVRARSSYLLFQQLYDFLSSRPRVPDVLRKFYGILDAKGVFGSARNAAYAAESLALLLRDTTEASRDSRE